MTSHFSIWPSAFSGAGLGLLWGVGARLWMRLISTDPEFSIAGTAYILTVATLFGAAAGWAWAARRRAWSGWRQSLPRGLVVMFFLPFGIAGGLPLMLTVLVFTLGVTQPPLMGLWVVAGLALLVSLGTDLGLPPLVAALLVVSALGLTGWIGLTRQRHGDGWRFVTRWLERLTRAFLLGLALVGFGFVVRDLLRDHPVALAMTYGLLYLGLLIPLYWGLRAGLQPKTGP